MKKYFFLIIVLVYSLVISAQTKEYTFVPCFNLNGHSVLDRYYYREYVSENIFIDSIFIKEGAIFKINKYEEWFIKQDTTWLLFFDVNGTSNYILANGNFSKILYFEKTKLICNGSQLYHVYFKSLNENCITFDDCDYYFTPKDGFIILLYFDNYFIRNDMIFCFKDYIQNDNFIDIKSIKFN